LQFCWRLKPDAEALLHDVIPPLPNVQAGFLQLLVSKKETSAAAKVWQRLVGLHQPFDRNYVYRYVAYLVAEKEVDQAELAWKQAAPLCGVTAYVPNSDNLLVNGDFSLDVLNGGFDWIYHKSRDVSMALDPSQHQSGKRSLRMIFDTRGIEDAGIREMVSVQPNTAYNFSAYFKADGLEGVGGPRFVLQDIYSQQMLFASDDLSNTDSWRQVNGKFTTGPDTRLLVVRVQRNPPGSSMRGKLWIDGLRLVKDDAKT
jgi:hypothetical protein